MGIFFFPSKELTTQSKDSQQNLSILLFNYVGTQEQEKGMKALTHVFLKATRKIRYKS